MGEEQERLDRALAVQKEMEELGIRPDVHTYNLLILACSQVKNEDKAVEVFSSTRFSLLMKRPLNFLS